MNTHPAISEYLELEKAANATKEGADVKAIAADVAARHDLTGLELLNMVNDHEIAGAC